MSDIRNSNESKELILSAIGNPNVDIIVELEDDSLIKKYDLHYDRTKTVDENFLRKIEEEFNEQSTKIQRMPGGCAQNTLRIFQWLIKSKFKSCMIGSVGEDEEGKFLEDELKKNGILTSYTKKKNFKTGFIFLLIHHNNVAPVYGATCLASWQYSVNDLLTDERALEAIKEAKIALLEGFFILHCDKAGRKVIEMCSEHGVITSFNICGEYVAQFEIIIPYITCCNIVIGNEIEFKAVCKLLNVDTENFEKSLGDVFEIMTRQTRSTPKGCAYKIKSMNEYQKVLIVTCGPGLIYCLSANNTMIKHQVPIVEKEAEKDTIGAGDSFLAGFFYGILRDFPIRKCLNLASLVGAEIVKQRGCVMPEEISSDNLLNLLNAT